VTPARPEPAERRHPSTWTLALVGLVLVVSLADLPRIGLAITRAFLPDAGVSDVVGIARSMAPR